MALPEKQKTIIALLADGEFHSGSELATALGISRSAVWKHLQVLSDIGIHYAAINGKGYRLDRPLQLLEPNKIKAALTADNLMRLTALTIRDRLASTNTYLLELALTGAPSGAACFAEFQTAGKGRRGRQWISPYGHNIYTSLLWRFATSPIAISGLSLAVGVAVMRALHTHFPQDFSLKWPNDIYYQGKKLGGILVEVSGESEGPCTAVIGVGLNLYLPEITTHSIDQPWTDLSQITGSPVTCRNDLAGALLNELLTVCADFPGDKLSDYLTEWRRYDCLKGKPATLFIGQNVFSGTVEGIDDQGLLVMTRTDGNRQTFASGEVTFNNKPL